MAEAPASGAHVADYTFRVLKQDAAELKVTAFTGTEGISELFHFRIELCTDQPALDLESYLAQPCILELFGDYGSRYVNGIVRRFERTGEGSSLTYYAAEVVPMHWQLTRRFNCRIFHEETCPDMTVPGIIQKVLTDAGIPADAFDLTRLDLGQYKPREYVVQYRVSDHDFISQLCEDEGIFYFFEHTPDGHVMVFGDTSAAHRLLGQTSAGGSSQQATQGSQATGGNGDEPPPHLLPYRDPNGLVHEREFVFSVAVRNSVEIGAVTLDDHNFTRPEVDLQTPEAKSDRFTALNVYDYPGLYPDEAEGKRKAAIRLREQQCKRATLHMKATARHLTPGYRFTLDEHPLPTLGVDYLITHVSHRATQPQSAEEQQLSDEGSRYEAHIRVIPFAVPFCPPRVTPLPRVLGCQTAQVVKQKGSDDEIYCDKFGRVKVQFYWDHEQPPEDSSMMIRVSQGWAGAGWGHMFLPRVGQEVIVDFLEGNPNRPIIVGRVYNGTHMPPYKLPDEKTKSTIKTNSTENSKRFHEIRFEDKNKKEQLFIRAQRRMDTRVLGTHYHTAGGSLHERVGGEDEDGNKKGRYFRTTYEGEDRYNKGDNYILIDDVRQTRVEKDVLDAFMKNYALFVGDGIEMNAKTHVIEMKNSIALKVGGNFVL
ncbi:MAG: type VI secretion system tip protein VgrG, partial [Planctomycetota bacterium]